MAASPLLKLGAKHVNQPANEMPRQLNLGSGKDFRSDFFNIDVDSSWSPDAVVDLSSIGPLGSGISLTTPRFGEVTLRAGHFDRIIAFDVLEHVINLTGLMTTCLDLLRVDGIFEIVVPYDLSYGAWQDPTHIRAFNERSWLYYTDWFWYLGWVEARFVQEQLDFQLSSIGSEMHGQGVSVDQIIRTPRAVDAMSVWLRKIALSPEDQKELELRRGLRG